MQNTFSQLPPNANHSQSDYFHTQIQNPRTNQKRRLLHSKIKSHNSTKTDFHIKISIHTFNPHPNDKHYISKFYAFLKTSSHQKKRNILTLRPAEIFCKIHFPKSPHRKIYLNTLKFKISKIRPRRNKNHYNKNPPKTHLLHKIFLSKKQPSANTKKPAFNNF